MVAHIRYVEEELNAPTSDAIYRVNVTPSFGYIKDEAVALPKHLSIMPPVNLEVLTDRWEDRILWSDPESDADSDNKEDEEDDDDEDKEDEDKEDEDKKRIPLFIDLNDPAMLYEAGVMRPQRLYEVIIQQNKGRHRIPNWKLERIAEMLSDQKRINQTGESRFNISNDQVRQRRHACVSSAATAAHGGGVCLCALMACPR